MLQNSSAAHMFYLLQLSRLSEQDKSVIVCFQFMYSSEPPYGLKLFLLTLFNLNASMDK